MFYFHFVKKILLTLGLFLMNFDVTLARAILTTKKNVILQHISSIKPKLIGKKIYTPEMIIRAFVYFGTSRALYQWLKIDYRIPSVKTLTRITTKIL